MDGDLAAGSTPDRILTELLRVRSPKPEGKSRSDEEEDAGAEPTEARCTWFTCFPSSFQAPMGRGKRTEAPTKKPERPRGAAVLAGRPSFGSQEASAPLTTT